jgi:cold shock CspA family protein
MSAQGRHSGRVVRWDSHAETGAVVVDELAAEVRIDAGLAVRELQPGELVEVTVERDEHGWRATSVALSDG